MQTKTKHLESQSEVWAWYPVKKDYPVLGLILLLAAFLRLNGLNEPGLWQDEVIYSIAAQKPIIDQITNPIKTLREDSLGAADPVLSAIPFSMTLKLGFSNYLARFPAVLFGILSVAMLYRLGQAILGNRAGLIAALLLCTSSFHLLYSQEARSYSQLTFFALGSFWFLYRAITAYKGKDWLFYTLFTAAGISSHYDMAFAIFSQSIFLTLLLAKNLLQKKQPEGTTKLLLQSCGFFILSTTIIFLFRLPWLNDFLYWSARTLGGPYPLNLGGNFIYSWQALLGQSNELMIIYFSLCLIGLGVAFQYSFKAGLFLVIWLILAIPVTIIGLWFVSQFFHQRHTIWILPAILLGTAAGIISLSYFISQILTKKGRFSRFRLSLRQTQWAGIWVLTIPLLFINLQQVQQNRAIKQSWPLGHLQEATAFIITQAQPNEVLIGVPNAQYLQFYIQPIRQDLHYLDTKQTTLPAELKGRWYVFYGAEKIPEHWPEQLNIKIFHDILVVYRPASCKIRDCLSDIQTLLSELAQANPGSPLADKIQGVLAGLMLLR